MLSNFLFSKPKNVGNAKCRPTIDRVLTNYWPMHRSSSNFLFSKPKNVGNAKCRPTIDWVLTNYWPMHRSSIDQLSTNYRRNVGEVSVNEKLYRPRHIWNDYRPCLDRVSTHYRPTIDRVSTEYRPTVDRVSTDYRPSVDRYIDRYLGRHYPQ